MSPPRLRHLVLASFLARLIRPMRVSLHLRHGLCPCHRVLQQLSVSSPRLIFAAIRNLPRHLPVRLKPIACFYGALLRWLDTSIEIVIARPNWHICSPVCPPTLYQRDSDLVRASERHWFPAGKFPPETRLPILRLFRQDIRNGLSG